MNRSQLKSGLLRFLLLLLFSVSCHLACYTHATLQMEAYPYRLRGETYVTLQQKSNPLDAPDREDSMRRLSALHDALRDCALYEYYDLYAQPLDCADSHAQAVADANGGRLPSMQISRNVLEDQQIQIASGRALTADDALFAQDAPIPVLLGASYAQDFALGDRFEADYLFAPYAFEVVGFFAPGSEIVTLDRYLLDDCVVFPSGDFSAPPNGEPETVSRLLHLANQVSGQLRLDPGDADAAYAYFVPLLRDAGVGEFSWYSNSIVLDYHMRGIDLALVRAVCLVLAAASFALALLLAFRLRKRSAFASLRRKTRALLCISAVPLTLCPALLAIKLLLRPEFLFLPYLIAPTALVLGTLLLFALLSVFPHRPAA